jgi:formate-dependent nitrite reductase membrane component NrfD
MQELTSTHHSDLVNPILHIWGWQIPTYLFMGGLVAGIMIISGYFVFQGRHKNNLYACFYLPIISLCLLSLGMLALFLDLEHKWFTWRLYTTFEPSSPMSWGSWILVLIYPALLVNLLVRIPSTLQNKLPWLNRFSMAINGHPFGVKAIGVLNMVLGAMLGMYTGVLLSALGARPLWNSAMLWILFLVSGLSAAAAFVHMITSDKTERELLAKADNGFLTFELLVISLFLAGLLSSTRVHIEAAHLLLNGQYAPVFWVFVVGLGIVIPLIIQLLAVNHKVKHTPIAPVLVILGGLILRFVIVYAGQVSHW